MGPELAPTPVDEDAVYGHIVNTFTGRDVDAVIVNGGEVLRGGKFIATDALKELDYVLGKFLKSFKPLGD